MSDRRGVSLIEVLIGLLLVVLASIATLTYFAYARGGIGKQGNRRAAVERARERLEQLMAAPSSALPALSVLADGVVRWCNDAATDGSPCTSWTTSATPVAQTVPVEDIGAARMETTIQYIDDPAAGTATPDVLELGVKVWFMPGANPPDTNYHRVHVRTLRTPPTPS